MRKNRKSSGDSVMSFLKDLVNVLVRETVRYLVAFLIAFGVGTCAGAAVCWYYGVPLIWSLAGGFLMVCLALAIALAVGSDSSFD